MVTRKQLLKVAINLPSMAGLGGNLKTVGALSGLVGAGTGLTAALMASPTTEALDNLRKEELVLQYGKAIDELKSRIAMKKQRIRGI